MKFSSLVISIALLAISCSNSSPSKKTGKNVGQDEKPTVAISSADIAFKTVKWGMNRQDVRNSEAGYPISQEAGQLWYVQPDTGLFSGLTCYCAYIFNSDDKLIMAKYMIIDHSANAREFSERFGKLRRDLTTIYGTPQADSILNGDLFTSARSKIHLSTIEEAPPAKIVILFEISTPSLYKAIIKG